MKFENLWILFSACLLLAALPGCAGDDGPPLAVEVSEAHFNPPSGQPMRLAIEVTSVGRAFIVELEQ